MIAGKTANLGAALALVAASTPIRAEQSIQDQAETSEPGERATSDQIFAALVSRNQIRSDALLAYSATQTYRVSHPNGKVNAEIEGRMEFQAPDAKRFVIS